MMRIALCDDEPAQSQYLLALLQQWSAETGVAVHSAVFDSAESFLFWYEDHITLDLLLLDIQMRGMDGVTLARKLRAGNADLQIIFITGYTDFIAQGYDVQALHYLMKPVKEDKLFEVLTRAYKTAAQTEQRSLLITADGETHRVPFGEITYIEAQGHYVIVHTLTQAYKSKAYITDLEKTLDDSFFRSQRSFIVNLRHVRKITRSVILLDGGVEVPLSRGAYDAANQAIIRYFP